MSNTSPQSRFLICLTTNRKCIQYIKQLHNKEKQEIQPHINVQYHKYVAFQYIYKEFYYF